MSTHRNTNAAWEALTGVLAGEPPASLRTLDDDALQQLSTLLRDSRQRQQRQLERALEDALGYVPALARGTVRRILFPERA